MDNHLLSNILKKHKSKKIIIFGAGAGGQTIHHDAIKAGAEVLYFIDNKKQGGTLCGKQIKSPYDILYENIDDIIVITGACQDSDVLQMKQQLSGFGLKYGLNFETPDFNKLYARIDYIDPMLGYSRSGEELPGFKIYAGTADGAKKIIVLGGSTSDYSFGGYKSWPELLHEKLTENNKNAIIYNGAIAGYFSAQEMIKVIRDCVSLHPDVIITFDGINEAIQQSLPGYPMYHPYSKKAFDLMFAATPRSEININNELKGVTYGITEDLPQHESWYKNLRIIKSVCQEFNISYFPFLQPNSLYGIKNTGEINEKEILINKFYDEAVKIAKVSGFIIDATTILDNVSDAYFDFAHYTKKGNGIIADFVYKIIKDKLA